MFFHKKKFISYLVLFFAFLTIFFLASTPSIYSIHVTISDLSTMPLLIATGVTHEVRAMMFFHRSYWQNLRLRQENDLLKSKLLCVSTRMAQDNRFKNLYDLKDRLSYQTVAALVIGKDFNSFRPYIVVNKGRVNGIKKYAPVFTSYGLVGKILEVGRYSSKVILINDPDLSVPAINVRTREQGLVSGTLDGRSKLRFLDFDSDVKEGDLIATSGLNMTYPKDILIGRVKLVGVESSGLGKFAILDSAVKVSSLEEALVVTSSS